MSDTTHRAFFGDSQRDFCLSADLVPELERRTGAGIGLLFKRLVASEFHQLDVVEVIRLGLVGGGTDPQEAQALIEAYVSRRPLAESYALAVEILNALWFGPEAQAPQEDEMEAADDA